MTTYTTEILVFSNGERYPILLDGSGMPHFHVTLWVTSKLRMTNKAVQTIQNKINHVKWFFGWLEKEQRDLYAEFKNLKFLSQEDIEGIRAYLSLEINKSRAKQNKSRNKVISLADNPSLLTVAPSVGRVHHYNRMTSVVEYVTFLAKLATSHVSNTDINNQIQQMEKQFKAARPKGKGSYAMGRASNQDVPSELVEEFMDVAHQDHPKNPFKNDAIRLRNHLMFALLRKVGVRKGEMLSLSLKDMNLHGDKKSIWVTRSHDDTYDPRKRQPVSKTKERLIRINDETAELLSRYIIDYRSKTPNANKHPYLFVTHRKCASQGAPVSVSTFDNTIIPAMKAVDPRFQVIHAHFLRHIWNEDFSQKIDYNNKLADLGVEGYRFIDAGTEAKMRMHQMGHASESSGNVYNRRFVEKKANEISLMEQKELQSELMNAKGMVGNGNE